MNKIKKILWILFACFWLNSTSCKTTEPPIVKPTIADTTPSWDGNEQNSGVIEYLDGKGWHITQKAANRYNELIKLYGSMFLPKLERGEGLTKLDDGSYIIDNEHIVKFILMNKKHKES